MTQIIEYPKIPGPFKREVFGPNKNQLIPWAWTSPELAYLADLDWTFTEKIDGTNIRVIWDGHKPEFRGRTDKANFPPGLIEALTAMFPEEVFEQTFGSTDVILFGEGYGPGIQKGGGNYRADKSFILFDVKVGNWWLQFKDVEEIAKSLGISTVPLRWTNTLTKSIKMMTDASLYSVLGNADNSFKAEGVVGQPKIPLLRRDGSRIAVKLKGCDLEGLLLD
jgi:hypothetical protein